MERLTERDRKGHAYFDDDGTLIRGANGTFHQKKDMTAQYIHDRFVALDKAVDLLADYEDTDLTPEEIKEHEAAYVEIMTRTYGPLHQKIGQWLQAEQDGRLALLPCKVGDIVYDILDGTPYATRVVSFSYFGDHWACRTVSSYPNLEQFGTRIFLTREEAEAALAERKERQE